MADGEYTQVGDAGCWSPPGRARPRGVPAGRMMGCLVVVTVLLAPLGCTRTSSTGPPARTTTASAQPPHVAFTISKETTCITEPLRSDGYPDYIGALNRRFSEGATPENNAAVLFWKAVGPEAIHAHLRDKYCQMLGIPPPPEQGDYFVDLDDYAARRKFSSNPPDAKPETETSADAGDLMEEAMKRPWSQQEFPVLAQWLAANEQPLALVVAASQRPRRYDPLCSGPKAPLMAVLLPAVERYRSVARALCCRATRRLQEGKSAEAWQDLLACHRLARLVGQGPTIIEVVVAFSMDEMACAGDQALLQHAQLTAPQIAHMREGLNALGAMPNMGDTIDVSERFTYLNNVTDCAAGFSQRGSATIVDYAEASKLVADAGLQVLDLSDLKPLDRTLKLLKRHSADTGIDWDLILRDGNSWFDRIAEAYRQPTRSEQREAIRKLEDDYGRLKETAADAQSLEEMMLADPRRAVSERFSQVLLTILSPFQLDGLEVEDRWTMRFELDKLGCALAAYCADHGAYPVRLADLVPDYVVPVPADVFDDSELHYRRAGPGYLLYSVGANGQDDGGKSYQDRAQGEDWDDLVLRVPGSERE